MLQEIIPYDFSSITTFFAGHAVEGTNFRISWQSLDETNTTNANFIISYSDQSLWTYTDYGIFSAEMLVDLLNQVKTYLKNTYDIDHVTQMCHVVKHFGIEQETPPAIPEKIIKKRKMRIKTQGKTVEEVDCDIIITKKGKKSRVQGSLYATVAKDYNVYTEKSTVIQYTDVVEFRVVNKATGQTVVLTSEKQTGECTLRIEDSKTDEILFVKKIKKVDLDADDE